MHGPCRVYARCNLAISGRICGLSACNVECAADREPQRGTCATLVPRGEPAGSPARITVSTSPEPAAVGR